MDDFCRSRNIDMEKIPPLHPSANPAETFMKSVGKTMKIASHNKSTETGALTDLLTNYRDTPHPATGVTPNDMMFRDPPQTSFPRRSVPEKNINEARIRDSALKHARQEKINAGKYRQQSVFGVGDIVLMRNYDKTSKYDPLFQYSPLMVTEVQNGGRCLTIQRISDGMTFKRNPDDLKPFKQHNTMQQSSIATHYNTQTPQRLSTRNRMLPWLFRTLSITNTADTMMMSLLVSLLHNLHPTTFHRLQVSHHYLEDL